MKSTKIQKTVPEICLSMQQSMNTRLVGVLRLFLVALVALCPQDLLAQADDHELSCLEAAYVINFIKFTTWPVSGSGDEPFRIRVLQHPLMAESMQDAPVQSIHNRPFEIRNCASISELADADIVFIPAKAASSLSDEVWKNFGSSTMIVSDWAGSLYKGATIQLMAIGGRMRFAINLKTGKDFNISSKLLRLAVEVEE
jgi:hypothetical protein